MNQKKMGEAPRILNELLETSATRETSRILWEDSREFFHISTQSIISVAEKRKRKENRASIQYRYNAIKDWQFFFFLLNERSIFFNPNQPQKSTLTRFFQRVSFSLRGWFKGGEYEACRSSSEDHQPATNLLMITTFVITCKVFALRCFHFL